MHKPGKCKERTLPKKAVIGTTIMRFRIMGSVEFSRQCIHETDSAEYTHKTKWAHASRMRVRP